MRCNSLPPQQPPFGRALRCCYLGVGLLVFVFGSLTPFLTRSINHSRFTPTTFAPRDVTACSHKKQMAGGDNCRPFGGWRNHREKGEG